MWAMVACARMTPQQLRALADEQEARGHACRDRGDVQGAIAAYHQAEVNRLVAEGLERSRKALPTKGKMRTIGTMEMPQVRTRGAAVSEAKTKNPTLFQSVLAEHRTSLPEWAGRQRELSHNTAQSWVKRGKGGRPIPRLWADRIAREFDDTRLADSANWPKGIRE